MFNKAFEKGDEYALVACDSASYNHLIRYANGQMPPMDIYGVEVAPCDLSKHLLHDCDGVCFIVAGEEKDWCKEVARMLARNSGVAARVISDLPTNITSNEALLESIYTPERYIIIENEAAKAKVKKPKPKAKQEKPTELEPPPIDDYGDFGDEGQELEPQGVNIGGMPFTICGRRGDSIIIYSKSTLGLHTLTPASFKSVNNLIVIAPLSEWMLAANMKKGEIKGKQLAMLQDAMWQEAVRKGTVNDDALRGDGVWHDDDRIVVNYKDVFAIDAVACDRADMDSTRLYITRGTSINSAPGMDARSASKIADLVAKLAWSDPVYGEMLIGWVASAIICGALDWRTHAWLLGSAGSGKTWTTSRIVKPLMGDALIVTSNTSTDAGIQQSIGNDAKAVLWEEAEAETESEARVMTRIMAMARLATDASTTRIIGGRDGTARVTRVTTQFLMSSTQKITASAASDSRFAVLHMDKKHGDTAKFNKVIAPMAKSLITKDYCRAWRGYVIKNAMKIRAGAALAREVVTKEVNDSRQADALSPLIAGFALIAYGKTDRATIAGIVDRWTTIAGYGEESDDGRSTAEQIILNSSIKIKNVPYLIIRLIQYMGKPETRGEIDVRIDSNPHNAGLSQVGLIEHALADKGIRVHNTREHGLIVSVFTGMKGAKAIFHGTTFESVQIGDALVQCGWRKGQGRLSPISGTQRTRYKLYGEIVQHSEEEECAGQYQQPQPYNDLATEQPLPVVGHGQHLIQQDNDDDVSPF